MAQIIKTLPSRCVAEVHERLESFSLLTFAPGSEDRHMESALLRWFKDRRLGLPGDTQAARAVESAFADEAVRVARGRGITHVCRVLGSWETVPEPGAPLEMLAVSVARRLDAEFARPMRRTSPREPMSRHSYLSGRDAIARRIDYARQDLVWEGEYRGARFLVLDDIRCLGASEAVWAAACLTLGGTEGVMAVNLGQTCGLSERGSQLTDSGAIRASALDAPGAPTGFFQQVWLTPRERTWHSDSACAGASGSVIWWRGLVPAVCEPCPLCATRRASLFRRMLRRAG